MIVFVDGFDAVGSASVADKYQQISPFLQSVIDFGVPPPGDPSGTGGYAYDVLNTAALGMVQTKQFPVVSGVDPIWYVHGQFMSKNVRISDFILRFESGPPLLDTYLTNNYTQLAVKVEPDGRLSFWNGGAGTFVTPGFPLGSTSQAILINTPVNIEILARFGAGGFVKCAFNDVLVFSTNAFVQNATNPGIPGRVTRYYRMPGVGANVWDNYVIADGQRYQDQPQGFMGPMRVTTHFPAVDAQSPQWTRNGGSSDAGQLSERGPDYDVSYTQGFSGQVDLFSFNAMPCYGQVLAVAINADGKSTGSLGSAQILGRANLRGGNVNVGLQQGFGPGYATIQAVQQASLIDSTRNWYVREIDGGWWGIAAPDNQVRITQYYLELVTSLRNTAYSCGGGTPNYAF